MDCFVVPVLFWCRPSDFPVGSSRRGAAEDNTHLLWKVPPSLHQAAGTQPGKHQQEGSAWTVTEMDHNDGTEANRRETSP